MKYPIKTANGDAGEFFFAFQIASVLKWPCRLYDIDIGIDAQVEIIGDDRTSTGKFVAFQVKATSSEEQDCRYVSQMQLAYWKELELPVFVVLVDLTQKTMCLHRVAINKSYPLTDSGSVRIDFDLKKDQFSERSGDVIVAAANEMGLLHVRKHLQVVQKGVEGIRSAIASMDDFPDPNLLIEWMDRRNILKEELAQASALVNALRVGDSEYSKVEDQLESALGALREYMSDSKMHHDWDDHGDITRFIYE